eukprot:EG_transcript_3340
MLASHRARSCPPSEVVPTPDKTQSTASLINASTVSEEIFWPDGASRVKFRRSTETMALKKTSLFSTPQAAQKGTPSSPARKWGVPSLFKSFTRISQRNKVFPAPGPDPDAPSHFDASSSSSSSSSPHPHPDSAWSPTTGPTLVELARAAAVVDLAKVPASAVERCRLLEESVTQLVSRGCLLKGTLDGCRAIGFGRRLEALHDELVRNCAALAEDPNVAWALGTLFAFAGQALEQVVVAVTMQLTAIAYALRKTKSEALRDLLPPLPEDVQMEVLIYGSTPFHVAQGVAHLVLFALQELGTLAQCCCAIAARMQEGGTERSDPEPAGLAEVPWLAATVQRDLGLLRSTQVSHIRQSLQCFLQVLKAVTIEAAIPASRP